MTQYLFVVDRPLPDTGRIASSGMGKSAHQPHDSIADLGPDIEWLRIYSGVGRALGLCRAPSEEVLQAVLAADVPTPGRIVPVDPSQRVGVISITRGIGTDDGVPDPVFRFTTAEGDLRLAPRDADTAAELAALEREHLVALTGTADDGGFFVEEARSLAPLAEHIRPATGTQPWVVLLARFADSPGDPLQPKDWFESLLGASRPGLRHYFSDISYGALDTTYDVHGWRTLPLPRAAYPDNENDLQKGCTELFSEIDFTAFYGVAMIIDQDLRGNVNGLGAGRETKILGQDQFWGLVWLGPGGWRNPWIWAQEMGHTYGLKHTLLSRGSSTPPRSGWDVMGTVTTCAETFQGGCLGQHTTGYHKDELGWLDSARTAVLSNGARSVRLSPLSEPEDGGLLYAQIEIPGETNRFYAVEVRRRSGYDTNIPGTAPSPAAVVHEIDLDPTVNPESLTLGDGVEPVNGPGGAWRPGESFNGDGVRIDVLTEAGAGLDIRAVYAPRPPTVRLEFAGCAFGTARFVPSWGPHTDDLADRIEAEFRIAGSANWISLAGPTLITAGSNQRVHLRARACNSLGCSAFATTSAVSTCTVNPP